MFRPLMSHHQMLNLHVIWIHIVELFCVIDIELVTRAPKLKLELIKTIILKY
jgi:hypothetical protein